jgi:hypothetical protein
MSIRSDFKNVLSSFPAETAKDAASKRSKGDLVILFKVALDYFQKSLKSSTKNALNILLRFLCILLPLFLYPNEIIFIFTQPSLF